MIGIGGCLAQQEGEKLLKKFPYVDFVFGTKALPRLLQLINNARNGATGLQILPWRPHAGFMQIIRYMPQPGPNIRLCYDHAGLRQLLLLLHRAPCPWERVEQTC